jgi:acetyl esterase/lipase
MPETVTPKTATPKTAAPGRPVRASVALAFALAAAWVGASVPRSPDPALTLSYGQDPRQIVVVYTAPRMATAPAGAVSSDATPDVASRPPLAVYVHGGAWRAGSPMRVRAKPQWFREAGWGFASVGYRLLPDASVEEQARDVAAGLRALRADAERLGFDPDRILLMGHSAGAHLAALVASDQRYLGADADAVRGVILLDGAGYDVANEYTLRGALARKLYGDAFGDDPGRQRELSPINHVDARDPPDWLIVFAESRRDAREQARDFGDALQRAGLRVERVPDPGDHLEINREFGMPDYRANASIRALMARVEGA